MGRIPRNYVKGQVYHLIQRGNNKERIFEDQQDKAMLMNIIRMSKNKHPCYLLYYGLMDNHYHLVFEMVDTSLSILMQMINQTYSRYYNLKYMRCGTIYGQRYSFYPVQNEHHFYSLLRYIAFNPVKAKLVSCPAQYRWCAHLEIISGQSLVVNSQRLLTWFGSQHQQATEQYVKFIEYTDSFADHADSPEELIRSSRMHVLADCFKEMIKSEMMVQEILAGQCSPAALKKKSEFITKADSIGFTAVEIARYLGISSRNVRCCLGARHQKNQHPNNPNKNINKPDIK